MLLHVKHTSLLPLKPMQQLLLSSKGSESGPEVLNFSPVMSLSPTLQPPGLNVPGMYLWWGMCSTAKRHRKMQFGRGWSWKLWRDFFFLHTFRKKRRGQRGRIKRKKKKKQAHIESSPAFEWSKPLSTVVRADWTGQNLTPFIVFCCGVPGMQEL